MNDSIFNKRIEAVVLKWQNGLHSSDCMIAIEKIMYLQAKEKLNHKYIAKGVAKNTP